jgi:hypothetical protein
VALPYSVTTSREGQGKARAEERGGRGGRRHPMSNVCIKVKPARLVERAAAPSGPMSFALRESQREGAE